MASDRIFGLVAALAALAYVVSATHIQTSFLSDPVGPRVFPIIIGVIGGVSALFLVLRPDPEPVWPFGRTLLTLVLAVIVLVAYAYMLKPLGFLLPTAAVAAILSYQISPRARFAAATGISLSIGLFVIFRFALGLGLVALPKWLSGAG
jgi:putative tricarboxylic transport membrane protein